MENYDWKTDSFYYGDIPDGVTRDQLVNIMAAALCKVQADQTADVGQCDPLDEEFIGVLLDAWFEHDSDMENKFDSVVPEDDFEDFIKAVLATCQK